MRAPRTTQLLVLALALAPILHLGLGLLFGWLGKDPVDTILNRLGLCAILALLTSLACTPLQRFLGWKWLLRERRTIGLCAFFFALAHVTFYVAVDQGFDWSAMLRGVLKRKFILLGIGAFTLLLPLAITSTDRMLKRLGFRNWKRLHRLSYLAAALACVHYFLRFKLPQRAPEAAGLALLLLLGLRLVPVKRRRAGPESEAAVP